MMKKTFFLLLISLIHSKIVNLPVYQLKDYETINVFGSSGLICYQLHEKFKCKYNNFFLRIKYYSQIIETQFYYNLTDVPCNHLKNLTIDFDNLPSKFQNKIKGPCDDYEGEYGYVLSRINEKQKFMLMLFYNHKGNYFSVTYNHKSALMDANREDLIYFLAFTGCFLLLLFPCCKKYCCEECCSC